MPYPDLYPDLYPGEDIERPAIPQPKAPLEWYTLDDQLRRDQVIEGFETFIWTERYSSAGDFQIVTKSTYNNRTSLAPGTRIGMEGSTYVMVVDTVDDDTDNDGSRLLNITGSSIENLLNDRVAMPAIANLDETPAWIVEGTPGNIVRQMFHEICVFAVLNANDTFPFFTEGTLLPSGNIPEPADLITVAAPPDTLYNTIKKICDTYGLGFRFVKHGDLGQLYFEVYTGSDRTSAQSVVPAVIFDPELDNLSQVRQLTSTALVKTTAYVFAKNGAVTVNAPTASPDAVGSERRVLFVNSSNTSDAGPDLTAALQQEGLIALSAQRTVYSFDGQLPVSQPYVYGTDYKLGDIVEERNEDGFGNLMMVTEQIFTSDKEGERAFPTLSISLAITPGSWVAWDGGEDWIDVPLTVHWADL